MKGIVKAENQEGEKVKLKLKFITEATGQKDDNEIILSFEGADYGDLHSQNG